MKQLTEEEFTDRTKAIVLARKIFTPHLTKDISIAFELYQKVLSEHERPVQVTTATAGKRSRTFMDEFKKPNCPVCSNELGIRTVTEPKGPANVEGYLTVWQCRNNGCSHSDYSKKSLLDWTMELEPNRSKVEKLNKRQRELRFNETAWGKRKPCCGGK